MDGRAAISPPSAKPPQSSSATLLAAAAIGAAAIAAYYNSLDGEFMFDDRVWIVENPSIRHLWPLAEVLFPADAVHIGGRPVVSLSLAVNYAWGGLDVRGYHALNLAIHIFAALALFGVVRRTLILPRLNERFAAAATPLAMLVALIWVVHPLQTEAVSYVIQRAESLVGLFYLLTLYCFIRGATSDNAALRRRTIWYIAAVASCLLGMATKEVMATAPLLVLLYDRVFLTGSLGKSLASRWGLYLALAGTWSVLAWVLVSTQFHADTTGFRVERFTPWWTYPLTEPSVLVTYLRLAFWPDALCFAYDLGPARSVGEVLPPALVILALLALTGWALATRPALGFLGAAFFLILAPTSSVPILDAAFEHRMYLPLAALATLVVIGGFALVERNSFRSDSKGLFASARGERNEFRSTLPLVALTAVSAFVIVGLTWRTVVRNRDYQSEFAIWRDTAEKRPNSPRAHYSLGRALSLRGNTADAIAEYRATLNLDPTYAEAYQNWGGELALQSKLDDAIALFRKAIQVRPGYSQAHFNLAHALAIRGQAEAAIAEYREAVRLDPAYAEAYNNLGQLLGAQGRLAEGIAELRNAIRVKPDYALGHSSLASLLALQGQLDQAAAEWRRALEIDPDSAESESNLAGILALAGKLDEAIAHYRRAIQLAPAFAEARFNLGLILDEQGNTREAMTYWREAVRLRPNDPAMLARLAWTLATHPDNSSRDGQESLELAERAVRLTDGRDPKILATLAAAKAETGQYPQAVEIAERALDQLDQMPDQSAQGPLRESLRAEIERFAAGFPYRQPPAR